MQGGRVDVNGQRAKPSKLVKPGDTIDVSFGQGLRRTVVVQATAEKRGPAKEAVLLYEETPESRSARERAAELRRLAPAPAPDLGGRPTKRDRRRLDRSRRG